MNIKQLPYIIAIAETGSLSTAARQVGVSQQALSKYLNELNGETGLPLFICKKRRYYPTEAGRLYIQTARQILELARHTRKAIAAMDSQGIERLRLGLSPNRGISTLSRIFPAFDRRYPRVELAVTEGYANHLKELLARDQLDAVLSTHTGELPAGLHELPLHSEELVLAVSSLHPLATYDITTFDALPFVDLRDLQDSIFILPTETSTLHHLVKQIFDTEGFHPQVTVTLPNIRMQMSMIRSCTRVGFLPAYYVAPEQGLSFFRLHNAPRLSSCYLTKAGHVYSRPERYLIWLLIRSHLEEENSVLWSEQLTRIYQEFNQAEMS